MKIHDVKITIKYSNQFYENEGEFKNENYIRN